MEITNQIKAKVFALYFGQQLLSKNDFKGEFYRISTYKNHEEPAHVELAMPTAIINYEINDCKLILKPLSSITDEDAIEVGKILFGKEYSEGTVYRHKDYEVWVKVLKPNTTINQNVYIGFKGGLSNGNGWGLQNMLQAYQYLQSKGYDMPQFLLEGKTLQEAGLAIYEK